MDWRKSSRCESSACVEVGLADRAYVRDSKLVDSPVLSFNPADWRGFLTGIKSGAYDSTERS